MAHHLVEENELCEKQNGKVIIINNKSIHVKIGPKLSQNKQLLMLQDVSLVDEINKEKFKFSYVSTCTHELNTPLHSLLQSVQQLEMSARPEHVHLIRIAKNSIKTLQNIVVNGTVPL